MEGLACGIARGIIGTLVARNMPTETRLYLDGKGIEHFTHAGEYIVV